MGRKVTNRSSLSNIADIKNIRLRSLKRFCGLMFLVTVYVSFCLSGLYKRSFEIRYLKENIEYCLKHPMDCYNDKTIPVIFLGILIWFVASFNAYSKRNMNLIHGMEYGSAKWGDKNKFNEKYAHIGSANEVVASFDRKTKLYKGGLSEHNKVLSENIRFKYDSSTLRNNNIMVVGGSGAGKTAFFLTPNLLSLHDCNIITDPKGSLLDEFGAFLSKQANTRVYSINMCEMEKSMHFNPFLYIRSRSDINKLISNLIQNTTNQRIKNSNQDPFWERAEKMFLESIFLYVWMECPRNEYDTERGEHLLLERNWKSVLYLIDEARFQSDGSDSVLDERMDKLRRKNPDHPAVKAYSKYRNGPDDTVRSVLMTVNARMQPFDNPELLNIFSDNEIPLDEFGTGIDGDGVSKSNLFIVIPDDDDTYNFVPGIIYTLLFQELYRQARFFNNKLPMDVGLWMDEFANIKTPANFDKILATCRSRGIYCVPILQSLAQLKTLFTEGAWEGIIGNCDTFLYLGGNEASTFEYISKLLGKWTIDKRTNGESKGSSGSVSENYDVLGRELMMEYELRLLPDDECIIFVRGEEPIRDKKWYPWEHEEYEEARKFGLYNVEKNRVVLEEYASVGDDSLGVQSDVCGYVDDRKLDYILKQGEKDSNIKVYGMDAYDFMMMDMDEVEECKRRMVVRGESRESDEGGGLTIDAELMEEFNRRMKRREKEEAWEEYVKNYNQMSLVDIYVSGMLENTRERVVKELKKKGVSDADIKSVIHPELKEEEVLAKMRVVVEMGE